MITPSPKQQWSDYKQSVYDKQHLTAEQEKECSNGFYGGMLAGIASTVEIYNSHSGARRHKEIKKMVAELTVIAMSNNPTGKN